MGLNSVPSVMSQRGDFQDKHKSTRKRSEACEAVWTPAFLAVASFVFARLLAQVAQTTSVNWVPFLFWG